MKILCKMSGEEHTLPCPTPSCPLFGDCMAFYESQFYKPMTNADRIRAMSDEELRGWLCSIASCDVCRWSGWSGCELLEWLQQPAKEDA